jgi:hypothetical protein
MLDCLEVAIENHTSSHAISRTQYTSFSPTKHVINTFIKL